MLVIYRFDYGNEALSKLRLNIGTTEEITESKLILQNNTHAKIETKDTQ